MNNLLKGEIMLYRCDYLAYHPVCKKYKYFPELCQKNSKSAACCGYTGIRAYSRNWKLKEPSEEDLDNKFDADTIDGDLYYFEK